jgi:glycosyltransferase involved in cell wall biosynthesis
MISIFTPTHTTKFIATAYASLQDQTFKDWEWIILRNNGCEDIEIDDPRVKVFESPFAPPWIGALKGEACSLCSGDILLEFDHDDLLTNNALYEVNEAFKDQEIGFVYSNTIQATEDFQKVQRFDTAYGWKYREVEFHGAILDEHISFPPTPEALSRIWFAPNHLRAFRKQVYDRVGGYNKDMRILDDLDLMCRMYKITKFKHIDNGLYVYRVHGNNTWLQNNTEIQNNVYNIYDKYIEELTETWAQSSGLAKLELGGRMAAKKGYITVDLKDADIISDLNQHWPFPDNSVGIIRAFDVFEHLNDSLHTMKELYRVLAPGGFAFIQVPSTDGRGAFQDPTHKTFWNINSFKYYTQANKAKYIDSPVRFQAIRLYDTNINDEGVIWTKAHLISLKNGYRPCGIIEI